MKKILLTFLIIYGINYISFAQSWTHKPVATMIGIEPYEIASGDFDNDGDIDLVMATYDYNGGTPAQDYIKWYSNDGSGNYNIEPTISSTIQWVDGLIVTDINNDGYDDIVATSVNQNKLVYFLSQHDGMGNFTGIGTETTVATVNGPGNVVAGDINNDTHMDLVTISYDNNRTQWFSGDGAGNFTAEADVENGSTDGPYFVDIADFDGDTDLDVVVGFFNSQSIEIYYNQYIESGTMTVSWIKDTVSVETGGTYLFVVTAGDVNNDGNINVVSVDFSAGEVNYFEKVKNGISTKHTVCDNTIINNPGAVFIADIDNDTLNDVIVSDGGSTDEALIYFKGANNANPSATRTLVFDNSNQMFDITVGDFDGDTDQDIATIGNFSDSIDYYMNPDIVLSVENFSDETISIYPNPTLEHLNFKGISNQNYDVTVTDLLGKNVMTGTVSSNISLNVSQLSSGIYIIKFNDSGSSFKFVKE